MNTIFNKLFILGVMMITLVSKNTALHQASPSFWGGALLIGFTINTLLFNPLSFSAICISLEKENLNFIRSLPFSFKTYLKYKLLFTTLFEWAFGLILFIVAAIYLRIPSLLFLAFLIGYSLSCYLLSLHHFQKDYRHLLLNWSDINELGKRGGGSFTQGSIMTISIFVNSFFIYFLIMLLMGIQENFRHYFGIGILVLILIISYFYHRHIHRKFWHNFD